MFNFLTIAIFWASGSNPNRMPKDKNPTPANQKRIQKILEQVENLKGNVSDHNNIETISELVKTLVTSHRSILIGNLFATALEYTTRNLLHSEEESLTMIHQNDGTGGPISIQKTYAHIGGRYSKKLRSFLSGPLHTVHKKVLKDSKEDYMEPDFRKDLKAYCGANQRGVFFFGPATFLTLNDIKELCSVSEEAKKLGERYKNSYKNSNNPKDSKAIEVLEKCFLKVLEQQKSNDASYGELKIKFKEVMDNIVKQRFFETIEKKLKTETYIDAFPDLADLDKKPKTEKIIKPKKRETKKTVKVKAALLSAKFQVRIGSRIPTYDTHVILHLAYLKENRTVDTVNRLVDHCIGHQFFGVKETFLQRLEMDEIIEMKRGRKVEVGYQVITQLNSNILDTEAFKDKCGIAKSWKRKIPSNGLWEFTLKERFTKGIDLNKLLDLLIEGEDKHKPASFFFIMEYFGDRRGSITRTLDNENIMGIYTPCSLNIDFKTEIKHISRNEVDKTDEVLVFNEITEVKEFEDETLAEDFYPTRTGNFNINFEDIALDKVSKEKGNKPKFILETEDSLVKQQEQSLFSKLLQQARIIDPDIERTFTTDDIPFTNRTNTNLRGENTEPPQS